MSSSEHERAGRHLRSHAVFALIAIVAIGLGFCAKPIASDMLIALLEQRFPRADIGNAHDVAGVIALGGNPDRIREAARLAQLYPHLQVIVTGAGRRAEVLSLIGPPISPDRIVVEERARNTYENATRIAGITSEGKWLLVTSASHMPRAMATFRKAGSDVLPWPIFDLTGPGVPIEGVLCHELIALMAYWAMGRSDAIWPDSAMTSRRSTHRAGSIWAPR
jgi:uncharacterized SAM-binding protein YcdF (DUF218 family)